MGNLIPDGMYLANRHPGKCLNQMVTSVLRSLGGFDSGSESSEVHACARAGVSNALAVVAPLPACPAPLPRPPCSLAVQALLEFSMLHPGGSYHAACLMRRLKIFFEKLWCQETTKGFLFAVKFDVIKSYR